VSHRRTLIVFLVASLLLIPDVVASQSLGEITRQLRQERKKHPNKTIKVYTNDNIPKSPGAKTAPFPAAKAGRAQAEAGKSKVSPAQKPLEHPTEKKIKTKEYWQARFRVARSILARAKKEQQLVEDELSLLQIQQIRELDPNRSKELKGEINEKIDELQLKRQATERAQRALTELEREFKESGALEDWIPNSNPT
jgi:hypothetical protein